MLKGEKTLKLKKTVSSLVLSAAILGSGATAAFAATEYVGGEHGIMEPVVVQFGQIITTEAKFTNLQ